MRSEGLSFLGGVALILAGVACGEASNNPNGISTDGRGGGSSTAGRGSGGSAMAGRGGSGGSAMAGQGGSAGTAGDSSDAGSVGGNSVGGNAGATGSAGSGTRPPGCPEPTPAPVAGQTIVLQSINFDTSELILRNATSTPQSITLGRDAWQWCAFPRYWSLADQNTVIELAPGETYSFIAINNQSGPVLLEPEEGEMAIYTDAQDFNDYDTLESFAAWGNIQAYRESYAVQRGIWTYDDRIQIAPGHAGFIATGRTDRASGYTSVPARCLVP